MQLYQYNLKQNDTYGEIELKLLKADNTQFVIPGGSSVKFFLKTKNGMTLVENGAATIKDASQSIVSYQLQEGDLIGYGECFGEFKITLPDGKVKTFPENKYINIEVKKSLNGGDVELVIRLSEIEQFKTDIQSTVEEQVARVNTLIQETPQPDEVLDIRVRKDGTVAPTAGTYVRELAASLAEKTKLFRTNYLFNFIKKCLNGTATWAAIGDSITYGSAATNNYGYAYLVKDMLVNKFGSGISMTNRGHSGYKVSAIQPLLDSEIIPYNYDLITIAAGTNDWNYGTPLNKFESDYRLMLETLISKTNADIICISLGWFDTWNSKSTPSNFTRETDYNKIIQKLALEYGLGYVDMYSMMKNSGYAFADITYAPDPVHPNDLGHHLWANELFTYMDFQGNLVNNAVKHFKINRFNFDVGVTYTGTWYTEGPYSTVLNSYYKRSSTVGNKATITFVGDNIKLYFVSDTNCGKVKITLDGVVVQESFDLYNTSFRLADISFKGLDKKQHTVILEVLDKNPLSSSNRVGFNVYDILAYGDAEYVSKTLILPSDLSCDYTSSTDTNTNYYAGTLRSFNNQNSKFSINAYGSKFKIFFTKGSDRGIVSVRVDGVEVGQVDLYNSGFVNRFMFETPEYDLKMHLIELVTIGKNASSSNYIQSVEALLCKTKKSEYEAKGSDGIIVNFQFYNEPHIHLTSTFNGTVYLQSATEKSAIVKTNPSGGTFNFTADGY